MHSTDNGAPIRQPQQQKKVGYVFPVDVIEDMKLLAERHNRSLVREIVWALRHYIAEQGMEVPEATVHTGTHGRS